MITSSTARRVRRSPDARRTLRTGALLLALLPATATLTSCGFDYPTDRVNTIAAGVNERATSVDALGIRILATAKGEGRLIGALSNNNEDAASLEQVTSPDGKITAAAFTPIEVKGGGHVNLATLSPITLTGDFTAGQAVPLDLAFSTGETAHFENVPVVKRCYQYTEVPSAPSDTDSSAAPSDAGDEGEGLGDAADDATLPDQATEAPEVDSTADATYECSNELPTPGEAGAEH